MDTVNDKKLWVIVGVLSLFFISCQPNVKAPELPQSVSPGWQLEAIKETTPHYWTASYSGAGKARVRIWAIGSSAQGLDRMQNWKPEANTVVFYGDHYFAAVDWSGVDRAEAGSLVRAVERAIGFQSEAR